jgi:lipopolysaccharide/colanic/teichoic acid biosynthesis glycosyltransferase
MRSVPCCLQKQMRRIADLIIASALLVLTLPLMLLIALTIKWDSPGPVLERRTRVGRGSRQFQSLTFRTMPYDEHRTTPAWARKRTPIGELLCYTRFDSLPQLINVLRGEMTILSKDGIRPFFLE